MEHPEKEAKKIVDAFLAYEGPDDLRRLQDGIAALLWRAYQLGFHGKSLNAETNTE